MNVWSLPYGYSPAPRVLPDFPSSMIIVTWNVNFMAPVVERLRCALEHMRRIVLQSPLSYPHPCCILLQEVMGPGFQTLLSTDWIQNYFSVIPQSEATDENGYGCVTLISNNIPLVGAWSLPFPSEMSRSAILTDLLFASGPGRPPVKVRVANVHLESLSSGARARSIQLNLTAERLRDIGVDFGIVGGDMNAISDSDRALPEACGLVDSWKGADNDESGFTWGYQPTSRFLPGRLDKICHTLPQSLSLTLDVPRQIGVNLKTPAGRWVSDHYGLATVFTLDGSYDASSRLTPRFHSFC
ncbi:Endonuclease/exonuclease/phosphatase [Desarmillaria tabescens]|uniref:Endonuclease/exonuclease/phosphatase n=1 Tax=Armillaria tabescens TaxID=1929756 RepID=A0AA39NP26_ARMTA|nr:Endonuclease/exonuclease/phosphatase [Desarmillaria tabescens]KAK0469188.1 Endonuclease/exonuclease/phosphatase [Desarmillaria tabescens]